MNVRKPKFDLGRVVVTPTASAALADVGQTPEDLLDRHRCGDWGDISQHERELNEQGVDSCFNLLSVYRTPTGQQVRIVTKGDRSLTLVHIDPRAL